MGIPSENICHLTITSTADLSQTNTDTLIASYDEEATTFNYHIATCIVFRNQYYMIDLIVNQEASDDPKTWACKMMPESSLHKPCWVPQQVFGSKLLPIAKTPTLIQTPSNVYSFIMKIDQKIFEYKFPLSLNTRINYFSIN